MPAMKGLKPILKTFYSETFLSEAKAKEKEKPPEGNLIDIVSAPSPEFTTTEGLDRGYHAGL